MKGIKIITRIMVVLFFTPGLIGLYSLVCYNYDHPGRMYFLFISMFNIIIGVFIFFLAESLIKIGQETIDNM